METKQAQQDAQALIAELQYLEAQSQEGQRQLNALRAAKAEVEAATAALGGLDKDGDKLFPVGAGVYTHAKTSGGKVLIEIGAGVVAEKTTEEAKKILADRGAKLDDALAKIGAELSRMASRAEAAADKLDAMRK